MKPVIPGSHARPARSWLSRTKLCPTTQQSTLAAYFFLIAKNKERWRRLKPSGKHGGNAAFCSRRPRKNNSAATFSPLKLIKFCGSKPTKSLFKVLKRRTGLVFASFAPQNRQKREKSRGFCPHFVALPVCFGFQRKLTHRPSELIKFPMPVARDEKNKNPAVAASARRTGKRRPRRRKAAGATGRQQSRAPRRGGCVLLYFPHTEPLCNHATTRARNRQEPKPRPRKHAFPKELSPKNRRNRNRGSFKCGEEPLDLEPRILWLGAEPSGIDGTVCFTGSD